MALESCPLCGQISLLKMDGEYRFEPPANIPGGVIVVAHAEWLHCNSCGDDILSARLEAAIDAERRRRLGLLSPEDIRNVRKRLGLSLEGMCHLLVVDETTYGRWESGRSLPTKSGDAAIRKMAEAPEMFAAPAAERSEE